MEKLYKNLMRKIIGFNRGRGNRMNLPVWWAIGKNYVGVKLEDGTLLDGYVTPNGIVMYENMYQIKE